MSNYEKSGPGGVGKRYNALDLGGTSGITRGNNGNYYLDFETSAPEKAALEGQSFEVCSNYGLVEKVYIEVQEAFSAGTIDILYDGTSILNAPADLTSAGMLDGGLAAPISVQTGKAFTVVLDGVNTSQGEPGYVKTLVGFAAI